MRHLIQSTFNAIKSTSKVKHAAKSGTSSLVRYTSSEAALKSTADESKMCFKGHNMVAPFTAGRESIDTSPMVIDKSEGCYVYDIHGTKYLDSLAGLWCNALGGNDSRLIAAATNQLNKLPFFHSFWNHTTKVSLDLAEELLKTFTARKMAKVFFVNSGSEANDTQVKLVWYYHSARGNPNKKKIIARNLAYHGSTYVAASLTGFPFMHHQFGLPAPFVLHTDKPHYWRCHLPGESEEEFATRMANNLEKLILDEGPETIGAFIAEPIMGAGGIILPPATYFEKVQAILKKYDILFIADEVITGFGKVGEMFGSDKYNLKPDLVSLAKALSSAYMPIGAVLISPEISEVIYSESNKLGSFPHGFTHSGHPVSCAVALELLKVFKEQNIVDHVQKIAPKFQDGLRTFADSPIIGEIRGTGLLIAFDLVDNKLPNDHFPPEWGIGAYFGAQCKKHGMIVRSASDTIMMAPPVIISDQEIDEIISKFGKVLKLTEERVKELKAQKQ